MAALFDVDGQLALAPSPGVSTAVAPKRKGGMKGVLEAKVPGPVSVCVQIS